MHFIGWNTFGAWLKSLREHESISQKGLADALGCHRIHIWRLENGKRRPSKIFLRSLEQRCSFTQHDRMMLIAFEQY